MKQRQMEAGVYGKIVSAEGDCFKKYLLLFLFISFKATIFQNYSTVYYGCSNAYDSDIKVRG